MAYTTTDKLIGVELANHLAITLTNLEFELLVRKRISIALTNIHITHTNLSKNHDMVRFYYSNTDKSTWMVGLGETYSKKAETEGEVLSHTFADTIDIIDAKERNKLSLLLSAPVVMSAAPISVEDDNIPF